MPRVIPSWLENAHNLNDDVYIVLETTYQRRTESGKSWKKPYRVTKEVISPERYFNKVFACCTCSNVNIKVNYTCAGYLPYRFFDTLDGKLRKEMIFSFAYTAEDAEKEGIYIGKEGTYIEEHY